MRQLIKFCLVGASSTVINMVILRILLIGLPAFPWWAAQSVAFVFGVTNGFYWNRRWTFAAQKQASAKRQMPKFVATNLIGLFLNLMIMKGLLIVFTGQTAHAANPEPNTVQLAQLCAIPLVVIWNFSASRFWTFRKPKEKAPSPSSPIHQTSVTSSE
jgi:putative flippase GtrA